MIYTNFQGKDLSLLGFGTMRLPTQADGSIDEAAVEEMTRYAIDHGVNYFDTAYPYHGGEAERVMGRVLNRYPRKSWYLATKYPGHQISSTGYDPAVIFEEQLQKCGVEYFDFYLLHNVYEKSMDTYLDPRWGIIDYFKEQKRLGRIKHLGFSCHASTKGLERFLDLCGADMEFCQIQLNYLDWTLQDAKGKYDLLTERGIPVWVMEPVRGGKLAKLSDADEAKLHSLRPEESTAAWGFRFLQGLPNVQMVLSGMSDMAQMADNVKTFSARSPLSETETALLLDIAEGTPDDKMAPMRCFQVSVASQYGTHVDVPRHFHGDGRAMEAITVQEMVNPLVVIDKVEACAANNDYMLTIDDLKEWEAQYGQIPEGAFVAFRSDWYKRGTNLDNNDENGQPHYPGWDKAAIQWLVEERNIAAIGHEPADTDPAPVTTKEDAYPYPGEQYILAVDRIQIEVMRNLDQCPPVGAMIVTTFPKLKDGTGFSARCFAICPVD